MEAKLNTDNDFNFSLSGDLSQMATQMNFLNRRGIITKQLNVYPCVRDKDVKSALKLIWDNRVEGWWHYKDLYVKHDICTELEFNDRF